MRHFQALYLCKCHAMGWKPSDKGLAAFVRQIILQMRLPDGRMFWEGA